MSTEGMTPVLVDQYGGLCTLIDRSDLPVGLSPACQNVEFFPGGVKSRSGFIVHQQNSAGRIVDMLTHPMMTGDRKLLVLSESGSITGGDVEFAPLAVPFGSLLATTTALGFDARMRGTSAFGRAYFGIYGNWNPTDTPVAARANPLCGPFQYDGVSISPVSQAGPPASFTVANTGGGSIGMSAGRHDFVIVYETATGYVTQPSAPVGDTFTAGDYAALAVIPRGPGAIVKRIVFATPAGSTSFFTLPRFALNDNTTTTLSVDFTDAELISGASLEDYLDSPRLPAFMGVEKYGRRLVYWGGNDRLQPFFDGDASAITAPILVGLTSLDFDEEASVVPAPWVATGAGGAVSFQVGAALQIYRITGNGATATRGQIDQVAVNVGLSGDYYIKAQRKYGIRFRVRRNSTLAAGTLTITLRGSTTNVAGAGVAIATYTLPYNSLADTEWHVLSGAGTTVAASYPYVNMTIVASGTPTNNGTFEIDYVEIFDAINSSSRSVLWVTQPNSPETVNEATGLVPVAEDDGQNILNVFELRGNLYICKEHSLYVTTDDGNDPADWKVDQVSNVVGTVSPHGVAVGDGWALLVDRNGLYYFTGGVPEKMSQEIQPTWDVFDWGWGIKAWVAIDPGDKRVYVGAPTFLSVSTVHVLDYVEGFGDPVANGGTGRKWAKWLFTPTPLVDNFIQAGLMVERANLTASFFTTFRDYTMTSGASSGTVEDSVVGPIISYYETAPIGTEIGRSLFDRLVMRIRGAGSLVTQSRTPGGTLSTLPTKTLAAAPDDDVEIKMRAQQTQVGFRVGTSGAADYWSLRRLAVFLKPSEFSYLRKT